MTNAPMTDGHFAYIRGAFEQLDKRMSGMEHRFDRLEHRFEHLDGRFDLWLRWVLGTVLAGSGSIIVLILTKIH